MVGHQNAPIHIKWAAKVSTLRTTALELLKAVCKYIFVQEGALAFLLLQPKLLQKYPMPTNLISLFLKSGLNFFSIWAWPFYSKAHILVGFSLINEATVKPSIDSDSGCTQLSSDTNIICAFFCTPVLCAVFL